MNHLLYYGLSRPALSNAPESFIAYIPQHSTFHPHTMFHSGVGVTLWVEKSSRVGGWFKQSKKERFPS